MPQGSFYHIGQVLLLVSYYFYMTLKVYDLQSLDNTFILNNVIKQTDFQTLKMVFIGLLSSGIT